MVHYTIVFLIVALIAALIGFGGIAVAAAGIAKLAFIFFLTLAAMTFLMSLAKN